MEARNGVPSGWKFLECTTDTWWCSSFLCAQSLSSFLHLFLEPEPAQCVLACFGHMVWCVWLRTFYFWSGSRFRFCFHVMWEAWIRALAGFIWALNDFWGSFFILCSCMFMFDFPWFSIQKLEATVGQPSLVRFSWMMFDEQSAWQSQAIVQKQRVSVQDHLPGNLICARSNIGKKAARCHVLWTLGFCFSEVMILRQVRPAVA